jgi:hypothetical protein
MHSYFNLVYGKALYLLISLIFKIQNIRIAFLFRTCVIVSNTRGDIDAGGSVRYGYQLIFPVRHRVSAWGEWDGWGADGQLVS